MTQKKGRDRVMGKITVVAKANRLTSGARNTNHQEETIGAAVAFADLRDFETTSFPNVSRFEDNQFYFESEITSEHCFEDIVGQSPALRKVLEHAAIVAPTHSTVPLERSSATTRPRSSRPLLSASKVLCRS